MDVATVLQLYQSELRSLVWPGETLETLPTVTRRSSGPNGGTVVTAFKLDPASLHEAIREELELARQNGNDLEWKVFSFDEPADLLPSLQAAGFTIGRKEALAIYDLSQELETFGNSRSITVSRITQVDQLPDYCFVAEAVFEKDYSLTTGQLMEALKSGQTGHDGYIAYLDGKPVGVARLYTDPGSAFAGLYGGGVLPRYRGQGCYRALIAARAQDALAAGARFLQVDALPSSLPILLRLGFVHVADTWPCELPNHRGS